MVVPGGGLASFLAARADSAGCWPAERQVAAKLLLSKRPTSAFRRLTDAAEWVAKAASEDRLAINGGHMVSRTCPCASTLIILRTAFACLPVI